ncbi:MAG: tetratricopeptide repeat protein [Pyrinomonadaceae bacterium]
MAIKSIQLNNFALQSVSLGVAAVLCIPAVYFAAKWCLADTLATQTPSVALAMQTPPIEIAEYAVGLSPNDPKTHYSLAWLRERTFLTDDFQKSLEGYERAVSLAPHDFRLWFDLAKARDQNGDSEGAEKAYRKALEIAPNYSRIHWALGNLLLRQGKADEAFAEIRAAAVNDPTYANPAVGVAWQFYDGNVPVVTEKIGDSTPIRAALSNFLAKQKRFDESFALWNQLSSEDKKTTYKTDSDALLQNLLVEKKFRDALTVYSQIIQTEGEKAEVGKITNSGFEAEVKAGSANLFEWTIAGGLQPQVGFDPAQKHGGNRSLVIVFNSMNGQDFRDVFQIAAVESSTGYHFETFARSDLKSPATVRWDVVDTADGKILASTEAVPTGSDWMPLTAEFTTAPTTQAVSIRLARVPCPVSMCPISGKVWFDDLSLKKSE